MNTKRWIIIFSAVIVLSVAAWLIINSISHESRIAVIYQNGEVFTEIDLNSVTEPYEISLTDEGGGGGGGGSFNNIYVENGRISMSSASCPDQICVDHNPISNGIEPIVCLPNKVIIQIEKSKNDIADAVGE